MEALEMLKQEHDIIERVLDLLEQAADRVESGQLAPEGFEPWTVEFFRHFADHCHHAKEEDILFPLLEERGIPREGGPIGCMLSEHEIGRECVRRMDQAASASPKDDAAYTAAAKEYTVLLREHIFKENNVLFPMAQQCLSQKDAAGVLERFRAVEEEKGIQDCHHKFEAEVARWEEAFK